jgi:hypothetical protein
MTKSEPKRPESITAAYVHSSIQRPRYIEGRRYNMRVRERGVLGDMRTDGAWASSGLTTGGRKRATSRRRRGEMSAVMLSSRI